MKTRSIVQTMWILGLFSVAPVLAEEKPRLQIRDAPTHEDLSQTLRQAQENDPISEFKPGEINDPTKENKPVNIIEDSDIFSFNGLTALVPKRAILALPDAYKSRVGKHVPGHRVVSWKEFHVANRGWITTVEVSRVQAEGNSPLAEETTERMSKATNVIVATYQGGPISVLPPKVVEASDAEPSNDPE